VPVKRLELASIRLCPRCGRGRAELVAGDVTLTVALDPARARELAGKGGDDELRSIGDLFLEQLKASRAEPKEVVLDTGPAGLRALLSIARDGDSEVVSCTAQEGVGLAVRGRLLLYATDDALAHAATRPTTGGPETLH
jgi:hypothetical protein